MSLVIGPQFLKFPITCFTCDISLLGTYIYHVYSIMTTINLIKIIITKCILHCMDMECDMECEGVYEAVVCQVMRHENII